MRSSVIRSNLLTVAGLSLLSACNNFAPNLRQIDSKPAAIKLQSQASLSLTLGPTLYIVKADLKGFENLQGTKQLSSLYLQIVSESPWPVTVNSLHSITSSKKFLEASTSEKICLLEILRPAFNADTGIIFQECFESEKFWSIMKSHDLIGQSLFTNLHKLATQPVEPIIEQQREKMIVDLFEFAYGRKPLDQCNSYICGPVACLIALDNKAEITRLVQGLSSNQKSARLSSGIIMQRCDADPAQAHDTHISPALRLLASSVLDHSNGNLLKCSVSSDLNNIGPLAFPGMLSAWCLKAMNDLTARPHTLLKGKDASVHAIKNTLDRNGQYAVVLRVSSPLNWHWIVVRRIEGQWAYFQDPRGAPPKLVDDDQQIVTTQQDSVSKPQAVRADFSFAQLFAEQSRENFPDVSYGQPQDGIYRIPVSKLANCCKAIIVPTSSLGSEN